MNRSEAPTRKRLLEARTRGQVARSRHLIGGTVLAAATLGLASGLHTALVSLGQLATSSLELVAQPPAASALPDLLVVTLGAGAWVIAPVALLAMGVAMLVAFAQIGPVFAWRAVLPDPARLWDNAPLQRLASPRHLARVAVLLVTGGALVAIVWWRGPGLLRLIAGAPRMLTQVEQVARGFGALVWPAFAAVIGLGVVDLILQRVLLSRELKMTVAEVRRESREAEANGEVARARRGRGSSLEDGDFSSMTMLVGDGSTVVVIRINVRATAPRVIEVGRGALGVALRAKAATQGLEVHEDPGLTATLTSLEIGTPVPPELFDALAHVSLSRPRARSA